MVNCPFAMFDFQRISLWGWSCANMTKFIRSSVGTLLPFSDCPDCQYFFRSVIYILLQNPQLQEGAEITHAAAGPQDSLEDFRASFFKDQNAWKWLWIAEKISLNLMVFSWFPAMFPALFLCLMSGCAGCGLIPGDVCHESRGHLNGQKLPMVSTFCRCWNILKPIHGEFHRGSDFRFFRSRDFYEMFRSMVYLGWSWWWCEELRWDQNVPVGPSAIHSWIGGFCWC